MHGTNGNYCNRYTVGTQYELSAGGRSSESASLSDKRYSMTDPCQDDRGPHTFLPTDAVTTRGHLH